MFPIVLVKELVHGSSFIYHDQSEKKRTYGMHRLVRRFIISDMERSSIVWKNGIGRFRLVA